MSIRARLANLDAIDRVAPTLEPDAPVVMHQDWHHLLFLHWKVPPQELQQLVAPELTIDTFDGNAYVGLVPFFCPAPLARLLKSIEPTVETIGAVGRAALAVYAVRAVR